MGAGAVIVAVVFVIATSLLADQGIQTIAVLTCFFVKFDNPVQ